eukprot:1459485-Amphidinium_carterae.1
MGRTQSSAKAELSSDGNTQTLRNERPNAKTPHMQHYVGDESVLSRVQQLVCRLAGGTTRQQGEFFAGTWASCAAGIEHVF